MAVDPQDIVQGLVARGMPLNAAIGFAGNFGVESRFEPGINEIAPVVPGSRGGYGLAQWTGPRRRQYESFAGERGAALDDLNTQLDFLTWELGNTEQGAASAIYAAADPVEAARLVSERFLRPGVPHMDARIAETQRIAGMAPGRGGNALSEPQNPFVPPQNALAGQQRPPMPPAPPEYSNSLDVASFMRPLPAPNALAQYGFAPGQSPYMQG